MAISRPFLLALLGVVLLGATALAVQNARTGSESDSTPAIVQSDPAPASQQASANATPADTLRSAFDLDDLKSARFAAQLRFGTRSQSARFDLRGAYEAAAANDMPKFAVSVRIPTDDAGVVRGGLVSLGDTAYLTRGETGWRLPVEAWDPVVQAVAKGGASPQGPSLQLHPETWVRDVKSEGAESVGGVETDHVSATVDPAAVITDFMQAAQANGAELPNTGAVQRAVKKANVDVWVGEDDHILRRLSAKVALAGNGRFALDVRLTDVNEPQRIERPAHVRAGAPGGAFGQVASALVGGITGGTSLEALTSPNPRRAARAVRDHRKVVILFRNPRGLDDRAMGPVMRNVDRRTKALVLTDHVDAVDRYGSLVKDLGVSQTPSVVIIDRSGKAKLIEGFADSETLTQAVTDTR
jgi:hypothetical protein